MISILVRLAVLIAGAEMIVRSGSKLAARTGVAPLIIGLTFVALGTSAPELGVGIRAALEGEGSLAVGNIAGTNTVNILLILGFSAALRPLALRLQTLRLELPAIVAASLALGLLAADARLSRTDGVLLVALDLAFTVLVIRVARREGCAANRAFAASLGVSGLRYVSAGAAAETFVLSLGVAIIVGGAHLLVDGSVALSRLVGVTDAFIGLTVVAIGTSAPELVTTIISTVRNNRDIAVGNLIGSSVYNILIILGITCLVLGTPVVVEQALIAIDIPVMIAVAIVCVPVFYSGREVSRAEGATFVVLYLIYLGYLIAARA